MTKRTDNIDAKRMIVADRVMPTTTALQVSPNPVAHGSPATLTATVTSSAGTPNDGQVKFYDGSSLIATASVNSSGVASASYTWSAAGSKTVVARFGGNGVDWAASTSNAVTVTVS